jgi:hypothetical protein
MYLETVCSFTVTGVIKYKRIIPLFSFSCIDGTTFGGTIISHDVRVQYLNRYRGGDGVLRLTVTDV